MDCVCPGCGVEVNVLDDECGTVRPCPICKHSLRIPAHYPPPVRTAIQVKPREVVAAPPPVPPPPMPAPMPQPDMWKAADNFIGALTNLAGLVMIVGMLLLAAIALLGF